MGDFSKLIVERRLTVSSWKTHTFSSNLQIPWFLILRIVSRELTREVWVSFMDLRALACLFFKSSFLDLMEALVFFLLNFLVSVDEHFAMGGNLRSPQLHSYPGH